VGALLLSQNEYKKPIKMRRKIMNWGIAFKVFTLGIGGVVGYLFGGWSLLLQILLTFMVIDYFSGMIASYIKGELSSKIGFRGIAKKVVILFIVVAAHMLDQVLNTGQAIRDGVMFFYMGNELLSFVENAGRMGVPLPAQLTNAVAILKGKGEIK
jgi:toxin secretion/phage lysis holin